MQTVRRFSSAPGKHPTAGECKVPVAIYPSSPAAGAAIAGQIAELANDWDGYTGVIPKSSATIAEVLGNYGYATAAFGKDHNMPVDTLGNGPYDRFPTGRGFDYFYGFIAGETSQW